MRRDILFYDFDEDKHEDCQIYHVNCVGEYAKHEG